MKDRMNELMKEGPNKDRKERGRKEGKKEQWTKGMKKRTNQATYQ